MNQEPTCPFPTLDWKQVLNIALMVALVLPLMALRLQPSACVPAVSSPPPLNWTSANWGSANWSGDCWASCQLVLLYQLADSECHSDKGKPIKR